MSDFSRTLVLQFKTSKIINDMANISIKSDKTTAFGEINFVLDKFDALLGDVIDSILGIRISSADTVLSAMAANFYQYIVSLPLMCMFGVEATDRVKSFLFRFIAVPVKYPYIHRASLCYFLRSIYSAPSR